MPIPFPAPDIHGRGQSKSQAGPVNGRQCMDPFIKVWVFWLAALLLSGFVAIIADTATVWPTGKRQIITL